VLVTSGAFLTQSVHRSCDRQNVQALHTVIDREKEIQMKSAKAIIVLSGVLLSASLTAPVVAAGHKPATMTCDEYVMLDDVVKPKVVYWAEGFNYQGEPVDAVIDFDATDNLVPIIVDECKATPKESFWEKVKRHF
jgi:hypothetical protein